MEIEYTIPVRTVSEANRRDHWAAKASRTEVVKGAAYVCTQTHDHLSHRPPDVVQLMRLGPKLLDDDNLRGALKAIRDGIAKVWHVDDGPCGPIAWEYCQGRTREYSVRVRITWREE